jgi:hypothetical protein
VPKLSLEDNIQNNVWQSNTIVFHLKVACFGLDIGNHQAKNVKSLKGK